MDELTLLRETRIDVTPPDQSALDRGRAALLHAAATEQAAQPRRVPARPKLRWAVGMSLAAAAVVTGLVATNIVGFGTTDKAVASVLHESAEAAIRTSDPVVGPGQYLRIDTTAVNSTTTAGDDGDTSYLTIATDSLFIPANQADDWVWARGATKPYKTFGPDSETAAAKAPAGTAELVRAAGGTFYAGSPRSGSTEAETWPTEPRALLAAIRDETTGQGVSSDDEALTYIIDTLSQNPVPAETRSALYEAAALIPDVEIQDDRASLNGRTGVAIGRTDGEANTRQEMIVDPSTGDFIGQRRVLLSPESGMPAGTITTWTSSSTTVSDTAPEGGTPNGAMDDEGCVVTGVSEFQC